MWKNKGSPLERCVEDVKEGFIVLDGSTVSYEFLEEDKTPFNRSIFAPILYIFKAHKNNLLRVSSSSQNFVSIYPVKDLKSHRMPANVYEDKRAYDLATFLLLPYIVDKDDVSTKWKILFSSDNFFKIKDSSKKSGASLIYLPHGASLGGQDTIGKVSRVMPYQILNHFFDWLNSPHEIYSHENTFNQKLEGEINIPIETVRDVSFNLMQVLETRFKTKILFDEHKRKRQLELFRN